MKIRVTQEFHVKPNPRRASGVRVEDNFGTVLSYARTLEAAVENVREMFLDNALDDSFTVEVINVIPNNPTKGSYPAEVYSEYRKRFESDDYDSAELARIAKEF
jgi:hypothetical protein